MTLAEAAERVGVTPATLRRWALQGLVPQYEGTWTTAAVSHARVVHRMRERGHSIAEIRLATEQGRLAFGYLEDLFPSGDRVYTLKRGRGRDRTRAGADRADRHLARAQLRAGRLAHRRRSAAAALHLRGARRGAAAGGDAAARAGLRPGAGAGGRRRGPAVPPVRARAADAVGRDEPRDGRADGAISRRDLLPLVLAGAGPGPPALPPVLRRAGRRRPHGGRSRRGRPRSSAGCASRSRSPTWPGTRG